MTASITFSYLEPSVPDILKEHILRVASEQMVKF